MTTISCDPHKYGLGPKGVSVLMFKSKELRKHQLFSTGLWNGGLYGTSTIAGSRPGNVVVATWAVMMRVGKQGYIANAKAILDAVQGIKREIDNNIPELTYTSKQPSPVLSII